MGGSSFLFIIGMLLGAAVGYYYTQASELPGSETLPEQTISDGSASLYVCPQDECAQQLITFINSAKKSVHVMIYSLTLDEVSSALIQAHERGVDVKVLMDNTQAGGQYSEDEKLIAAGLAVKIVNLPSTHIFHNKITLIDGERFSTGSFNYTQNADTGNAENLIMISNQKMTQKLEQEFQRYWNEQ